MSRERVTAIVLLAGLCLAASGCSAEPVGEMADTVYTNGKIYTVNEDQPWAEAVAIKDGKLLKVGSSAEIKRRIGDSTETVDLEGRFVMPGIVDLHVHPFATPLFNMMNLDWNSRIPPTWARCWRS